jgi:hypothetical protein
VEEPRELEALVNVVQVLHARDSRGRVPAGRGGRAGGGGSLLVGAGSRRAATGPGSSSEILKG